MALNIIFMGTPDFAVPILESIYRSEHKILAVYTQPPKKRDRGQHKSNSPISEIANKLQLKVRCPENFNSDIEFKFIKNLNPKVVVVVAYGKIIPKKFLDVEGLDYINIHASLLPKLRGAAPIQRAIMNLDKETGISIMKIVPKLDTGPVMMRSKLKIDETMSYFDLSKKMSNLSSKMILDALKLIEEKKAVFVEQSDENATYAKKIEKKEAKIDWREEAKIILAKINAFNPNPGAWFDLNGIRIKVIKAKVIQASGKPGEVLDNNFTVACLKNAVRIIELKKEGKKNMSASEFLKGYNLEIGSIIQKNV